MTKSEPDLKKVVQKISSEVAERVFYVPSTPPYNENPLGILEGENRREALCLDNALILLGLL